MRLVVRDLRFSHSRGGAEILRGISFDLASGSSMAIMGPSGSGKTTLLAVIGGLLRASSGEVVGAGPDGMTGNLTEHVAWIFQTVSLFPDRSIRDNVAIGAFASGANLEDGRRIADHALYSVGLGERAPEAARVLSGGEAQRVAIARALASRRPLVLADEPTGQLDSVTSAVTVEAMFSALAGRSLVVATHDEAVAWRCDRVCELREGELREVSSVASPGRPLKGVEG